uniref:Uncharacterized protein n=1 Tax=Myripristis murdjan TaxID=586833 RepID=A0A667X968_9TELE
RSTRASVITARAKVSLCVLLDFFKHHKLNHVSITLLKLIFSKYTELPFTEVLLRGSGPKIITNNILDLITRKL